MVPMTSTETRPPGPETASPAELPLQPEDPPRIGNFWLLGRIFGNAAGYLYAGRDEADRAAVVVMMTEGSADDAAARDRFDAAVDGLPDELVLGRNSQDEADVARWVALAPVTSPVTSAVTSPAAEQSSSAADARRVAERHGEDVLSAVLMDRIPHLGRFRGPDFLHYWDGRRRPGLFRLWPLPWPGRLKTASWLAMLLALLTMLVLMAVALLIAWLLFRNAPQVDPGPVIPDPNGTRTVTVTPTSPPTGSGSSSPTPSQNPTTGSPSSTTPGQSPTPGRTTGQPTDIPTGIPTSGTPPTDPGDRF
jgi:hypothetical protein